jgi:uncharacterized protein YcgL (UPF0745 family)
MNCRIYRCAKKQEMYLYVLCDEHGDTDIEGLPAGLLKLTGNLEKAMDLELTPERKLARADVTEVMESLNEKGFYLQMPPGPHAKSIEEQLRDLYLH